MTDDLFSPHRRELFAAIAALSLASQPAFAAEPTAQASATPKIGFVERRIPRDGHSLYVRDYPGAGPAFVLLHGFPDNHRIYDLTAPLVSAGGRRVVTFDFLGFGASDKPDGYRYGFDQQLGDLDSVVRAMDLGKVVVVGHDSGGPCAVNYAIDHPERTAGVVLMNTYYAGVPDIQFPELIELCAEPKLKALSQAIMSDPKQVAWIMTFQNKQFQTAAPGGEPSPGASLLLQSIMGNFMQQPSAIPAFLQMTAGLHDNQRFNEARAARLKRLAAPVTLVWGAGDPYLTPTVARRLEAQFSGAQLNLISTGHWPQLDNPQGVAKFLLSAKILAA